MAGRGFFFPQSSSPPKPLSAPQSLPKAAATLAADKREPEGVGALPRCFPGTTGAREPAPGGRVGGQIRKAAGWGGQIGSLDGSERRWGERLHAGAQTPLPTPGRGRPIGAPERPITLFGSGVARTAPHQPPPTEPASARSAPPPFRNHPPRACFSSLVTTMTHRLTHLPRPWRRDRHPSASTHTLSHRCPQANAIASTHHTHIQTLVLGLSLPES